MYFFNSICVLYIIIKCFCFLFFLAPNPSAPNPSDANKSILSVWCQRVRPINPDDRNIIPEYRLYHMIKHVSNFMYNFFFFLFIQKSALKICLIFIYVWVHICICIQQQGMFWTPLKKLSSCIIYMEIPQVWRFLVYF